jgi:hypothetical protein
LKTIIFHENQLSERGTSIALFDYAYFARKYLDINPIIVFNQNNNNDIRVIDKFKKEFKVVAYDTILDVEKIIDDYNAEYFYAIKFGIKDNIQVTNSNVLIHSVFNSNPSEIHGDKYAVISEWLSDKFNNVIPYVPHMLNLSLTNNNFRNELNISDDMVVIGRYGANNTFNIEFVYNSILDILNKRKDVVFLFVNTNQHVLHERCLYFDSIVDLYYKTKFINTCDVFLHARDYGETFGLSVLEFASKNKQVISYDNYQLQNKHPLGGRNHFLFLGDNCFKYTNKFDLDLILSNITRINKFDTYYLNEEFSPINVMNKFNEVFLS